VRIADEEATHAPGLVDRAVDHVVAAPHGLRMRRVDGGAGLEVDPDVGQHGLHAGRREEDLRVAGPEADVTAAERALLEAQHARVEVARGLEIRRHVVGHDALDSHTPILAYGASSRVAMTMTARSWDS